VDAAFEAGPATVGLKTKMAASGKVSGTEASCQMAAGDITIAGKYELDKSGKWARLCVLCKVARCLAGCGRGKKQAQTCRNRVTARGVGC
jgi:hypothetical protein